MSELFCFSCKNLNLRNQKSVTDINPFMTIILLSFDHDSPYTTFLETSREILRQKLRNFVKIIETCNQAAMKSQIFYERQDNINIKFIIIISLTLNLHLLSAI